MCMTKMFVGTVQEDTRQPALTTLTLLESLTVYYMTQSLQHLVYDMPNVRLVSIHDESRIIF